MLHDQVHETRREVRFYRGRSPLDRSANGQDQEEGRLPAPKDTKAKLFQRFQAQMFKHTLLVDDFKLTCCNKNNVFE